MQVPTQNHHGLHGLTRIEIAFATTAIGIAIILIAGMAANNASKNRLATCASNLSQIGNALMQRSSDSRRQFEWNQEKYHRNPPVEVWYYMRQLSNILSSPKVLICPTDTREPAKDFSEKIAPGEDASQLVSYFIGIDARPDESSILLGDRHIQTPGFTPCSTFYVSPYALPTLIRSGIYSWDTNNLHKEVGQLYLTHGEVRLCDEKILSTTVRAYTSLPWNDHILPPERLPLVQRNLR